MAANVGPVQVRLEGLYGLLGVKDGSNPDVVTGFVQPTVEALPFWLRATRQREGAFAGPTVLAASPHNFVFPFIVPPTEWWYLHAATAEVIDAAPCSLELAVSDNASGAGNELIVASSGIVSGGAANQTRVTLGGVWMPPGSTLRGRAWGAVGVAAFTIQPAIVSKARV